VNVALMRHRCARERSLHAAHAALDALRWRAERLLGGLLAIEHAELERQRVEAAGNTMRAPLRSAVA